MVKGSVRLSVREVPATSVNTVCHLGTSEEVVPLGRSKVDYIVSVVVWVRDSLRGLGIERFLGLIEALRLLILGQLRLRSGLGLRLTVSTTG